MKEALNHAFMSLRVPAQRWLDKGMFEEVLGMLDGNRGMADGLALFTGFTHPPLPLETIRQHAPAMGERIALAKSRGYGCGVNVLATMGHHNENLDHSFQGNYTRRTDIKGNVCLGSFCPNDGRFVEDYVVPLYIAVASVNPDFIWIDDDVRSGHMPIGPDCFCDCCLERFAGLCGKLHTRESIAAALDGGAKPERLAFRKLWLQGKRDTINRLFETIEQTVHGVNPEILLGFMTGERYADGYDFDTQAAILAGPARTEVLWRPGGGFYRDVTPREMIEKSHEIGRQASLLPKSVRSIQSEIENFNYEALGKSVHINTAEIASHIAAGCTGAALNLMNLYEELSIEKTGLFREIARQRPFYDALVRAQWRAPSLGIFSGWGKDTESARGLSRGGPGDADGYNPHFADQWFELGLPMAYDATNAQMAMFTGNAPYAFTDAELTRWLSKGVYLDGPALDALNEMGYGRLTGFTVKEYLIADCIEQLTDHVLNGAQRGRMRDSRQSFWKCPCASLEPSAAGAETLARAVDYGSGVKAACCMGVFENELGGRVCAGGYYPWDFVLSHSKAEQCRSVVRWLTRDTLPAYVSSLHKVNLWARQSPSGRTAITLINSSMDVAEGLTLQVLTNAAALRVTDKRMRETAVGASGSDGAYNSFVLPALEPWSVYLAVTE